MKEKKEATPTQILDRYDTINQQIGAILEQQQVLVRHLANLRVEHTTLRRGMLQAEKEANKKSSIQDAIVEEDVPKEAKKE